MSSESPKQEWGSGDAAKAAISISGLSKCYHIYGKPRDRLLQPFARLMGKQLFREFWALRDVSFQVKKGQTVGIIGPNGSGKSTLLQLICGTLTPTLGTVDVRGRVAALLELGAGFNPEFTGRENVHMNAAILGLSAKEIAERFDDIVAFADIGDFLDQPVKTYSSGMFVRLAFSIAINVDPDILIVDEALAVGDIRFQARCFRKFEELQEREKTILFVSHSTEQIVRHCTHAVLLHKGKVFSQGQPKAIANQYLDLVFGVRPQVRTEGPTEKRTSPATVSPASGDETFAAFMRGGEGCRFELRTGYNNHEYRWGQRTAEIVDCLLETAGGYNVNHTDCRSDMTLYVRVRFHKDVARPIYGLSLKSHDGISLAGTNSRDWDGRKHYQPQKAGDEVVVRFRFRPMFNSGDYFLGVGVAEENYGEIVPLDRRYDAIQIHVMGTGSAYGIVELPTEFALVDEAEVSTSVIEPQAKTV